MRELGIVEKLLHEKKSGDPLFLMFQYNNNFERNRQKKN